MSWPSAGEGAAIIGIAVAGFTAVGAFVAFLRNLRNPPDEMPSRHDAVHRALQDVLRLVESIKRSVERLEDEVAKWRRP